MLRNELEKGKSGASEADTGKKESLVWCAQMIIYQTKNVGKVPWAGKVTQE